MSPLAEYKRWRGDSNHGFVTVNETGLFADTSNGEYGDLLISDVETLGEIRDFLTEVIWRRVGVLQEDDPETLPVQPTRVIVDGICRVLAEATEAYERVMNDPDALTVQLTLAGQVVGLRAALCVVMGWDPKDDTDREGKADDYFQAWLDNRHWT